MATISSGYTSSAPLLINNPLTWSFVAPDDDDIKVLPLQLDDDRDGDKCEFNMYKHTLYGVVAPS
jgi:hypothetical protein